MKEMTMKEKSMMFSLEFEAEIKWDEILAEFCKKLSCAARLLQTGEYLGMELMVNPEGNCGGHVFTNAKDGMTADDCVWIFQGIAGITEKDQETEGQPGADDCIYQICRMDAHCEEDGTETQNDSEWIDACPRRNGQNQADLIQMLQRTGAVLLFIFGADGAGIYVRTKGRMSLGMRALLSIVFPGTGMKKMGTKAVSDGGADSPEETVLAEEAVGAEKIVSTGAAIAVAADLLELFARKQSEKIRQQEFGDDDWDCSFGDDEDDLNFEDCACPDEARSADSGEDGVPSLDDSMLIDELELTVRSYNCLRRVGINTIGELRRLTDEELSHVRNLGRKSIDEVKEKMAKYGITMLDHDHSAEPDKISHYEMLNQLIGLEAVKEQVRRLVAYAKLKKDMEGRIVGNGAPIVMNMEFVGNPGTAKTTVARILAGILYEIGLLQYEDIVEVGRADLVGKYVGQTAEKVKEVFLRARGRVLFIDEAYSLLDGHERSFGDEAITTIVQEMENHRKETVVIFAGYPKEMAEFIERNPGLRSRVPFRIEFQDYSPEEMARIAQYEAMGRGFEIDPNAMPGILSICAKRGTDRGLGNGRFSRNLVEQAIMNYAARVYGENCETQSDFVLRAEDFIKQDCVAGAA